jgi:aspartyl-tRNA(Asn)/glutamyl-tRNA(Gln) amidotransferase subunit A
VTGGRPHWLDVGEARAALRGGELSARELVDDTLLWIEETDSTTKAWVALDADGARAAADAADRDRAAGVEGPLQGIPFGVKDVAAVAGLPMEAGSPVARGFVPREDSTVVARLRAAGGICLGKTVTHEFAFGSSSPPARNPWDGKSVPGGSSGGSAAAVAAGQAVVAVGTDNCCSVRNPAALNGVCGIRPTFGRVSTAGVVPASLGLDTVGPICRTVADVATLLTIMSSFDPVDPRSSRAPVPDFAAALERAPADLDGLRVGVPESHFFEHLEADVERSLEAAMETLRDLGATLAPVELPHAKHALPAFFVLDVAEEAALQYDHLRRDPGKLGEDVQQWAELGSMILASDYIRANQMRALITRDFEAAFESVDVILTPATAATAKPPTDHPIFIEVDYPDGYREDIVFAYGRFLIPVSMAGLPGLVVPCGEDEGGLPIGMQVVAPAFDEATAFRVGAAFERTRPPYAPPPPLATAG